MFSFEEEDEGSFEDDFFDEAFLRFSVDVVGDGIVVRLNVAGLLVGDGS